VCGQVTKRPENVAVLIGSDVTLRCAGTDLTWEEYLSDSAAATTITTAGEILDIPYLYEIITDPTGRFDLTISFIELEQGGRYSCKAFADKTSSTYAQVITFSGEILLLFLH